MNTENNFIHGENFIARDVAPFAEKTPEENPVEQRLLETAADAKDHLEKFDTYTERLALNDAGIIQKRLSAILDGTAYEGGELFALWMIDHNTPEELMQVAQVMSEKYGMQFTFTRDPAGRWFEYSVTKDEGGRVAQAQTR